MLAYEDKVLGRRTICLTKTNVMIGPIPLLRRTLFGVKPRPLKEVLEIFGIAGQAITNVAERYRILEVLANALSENHFSKAAMLFAYLRLPSHLSDDIVSRLRAAPSYLKANFDPSEPRDENGRWKTDGHDANNASGNARTTEVLDTDCTQVLAACRVECTDAYVEGTVRNFFDMRKCLRACMNRNGCHEF